MAGCQTTEPGKFGEADLNQNYYFIGDEIQVQGEASLPPATSKTRIQGKAGTRLLPESLPLHIRRQVCIHDALKDAQARWLAITLEKPADHGEWLRELENPGMDQDWRECLENSRIRRVLYDSLESCRVVAIIPCHPADY